VFNPEQIIEDLAALDKTPISGEFNGNGEFIQDKNGRYKLFESVVPKKKYAIGADVSEGLEGGDYSTMFGIDKEYNQIFSFLGHLDPDVFGNEMCKVGKHYNNALLAPERNNHGHATIAKIKSNEYPNIFLRIKKETRADEVTHKLGWETNRKTKMHMLDDFVELYRDGALKIKDKDLLKEMLTLIVESDGDVVLNGKDRTVAACIAIQAIKQQVSGDFKAHIPGETEETIFGEKSVMPLKDRIKHYEKRRKSETCF